MHRNTDSAPLDQRHMVVFAGDIGGTQTLWRPSVEDAPASRGIHSAALG